MKAKEPEQQVLVVDEAPATQLTTKLPNTMELLQLLVGKDPSNVEGMKELAHLHMEIERFHLEMRRVDAESEFNQELALCQAEVSLVICDAQGQKKKYASYKALDKEIRPIYLRHGFSLSFGSADCTMPNYILVTCHMSRGLHTRVYQLPMESSGLGPKGEGALSKPHAILAAMEYGRRCLLKSIFNIVTGEEDTLTNGELMQAIEKIEGAGKMDDVMTFYREAYKQFETSPDAIKAIVAAKLKRQKELKK